MDEGRKYLEMELSRLLLDMEDVETSSEEYKKLMDRAKVVADLIIEMEKNEIDLKKEVIKSKVPVSRIILDAAKIVAPLAVEVCLYIWGVNTTLRFEETGRFTSKGSSLVWNGFPKLWK